MPQNAKLQCFGLNVCTWIKNRINVTKGQWTDFISTLLYGIKKEKKGEWF